MSNDIEEYTKNYVEKKLLGRGNYGILCLLLKEVRI